MLEFFMSKPTKQLYWIRKGNMEKLEACYRNEGLLPKTEEALLKPKNRAVLLKFLKWGKLEDVAHIMELYLTRYRGEFVRNRRQGVSFDEDNLLMLIALCREYPAFLQEYVRRNGQLRLEYERVLFAYADISCIEWYANEIWYSMQALLFGYKSGIFKDSLQEYVRKHGK